jgi:CHAT domain-containing protein
LNLALVNDVLGRALAAQGRWAEVVAQYEAIQEDMASDPGSFDRLFTGNLYWALALLRSGHNTKAAEQLEIALRRTRDRLGDKHYKTAEIRGYLAMARTANGDTETAFREFGDVVPILLQRSRQADEDSSTVTARNRRLNLILEAYIGLLARDDNSSLKRKPGMEALAEAFVLAEHARSRVVLQSLSASGARAALKNPELADLARNEQDTQKRIAALYGTLAQVVSRPSDQQDEDLTHSLKVKIDQLRGARAALMEEIEARFPDYAQLVNPKPATIEQARDSLRPGEALIVTYVGEDATYLWAVPHAGEVAFATVPWGRERIETVVAELRRSLDPNAVTLGDIPDFDVALAHRFYGALLDPVKEGWQGAKNLLVVAHGALGQLPLSVLVTGPTKLDAEQEPLFAGYKEVPWLARSHAVTMLPSVSSLTTQRALPRGKAGRRAFVGFGDPWFSEIQAAEAAMEQATQTAALSSRGVMAVRGLPVTLRSLPKMDGIDSAELARLPRLPDTADEVRSIALAMNADLTHDVFTGKSANEDQVKTMELSGYKVLAFATHGLVPGDLNGLTQPALALSAPGVAGVEGDGLLTMAEILGLRLDADWVVLSACNTASGAGAGAEAVSGLGSAFFYAGTRALLVSNWPVETTSAKELTTDLFRRQATGAAVGRAEALRQSMLALVDGPGYVDAASGKIFFSYAHPIFWAPFTVIGDGGGAAPGT